MNRNSFLTLSKEERESFYQSKFSYFQKMTFIVAIFVGLGSLSYYITDCQLIGGLQTDTILPRFSMLLPLTAYIVIYPRISSYKVKTFLTMAICQIAHYCTIWSILYLPDQSYVCPGAIVIQVATFIVGFSAPFSWVVVAQTLVIANLFLSNPFVHYQEFGLLITMNLPVWAGMIFSHYWLTKTLYGRFLLQERLQMQSYQDQLTGLYNRHRLDNYVDGTGHFLPEFAFPVSVVIMDIDFFKQVNDTYGHDKGDIVLQAIAGLIQRQFGEKDSICLRWGGEEFLVILFGCDEGKAFAMADDLRENIAHLDTGVCPVTMSLGVAGCSDRGASYKEMIKKADIALYKAKDMGRNQTYLFENV